MSSGFFKFSDFSVSKLDKMADIIMEVFIWQFRKLINEEIGNGTLLR